MKETERETERDRENEVNRVNNKQEVPHVKKEHFGRKSKYTHNHFKRL